VVSPCSPFLASWESQPTPLTQRRGSLRLLLPSSGVVPWAPDFGGRVLRAATASSRAASSGGRCARHFVMSRRDGSPSFSILSSLLAPLSPWPPFVRPLGKTALAARCSLLHGSAPRSRYGGHARSLSLCVPSLCRFHHATLTGLVASAPRGPARPSGGRVGPHAQSPPFGRGSGPSLCQESSTMRSTTSLNPTGCPLGKWWTPQSAVLTAPLRKSQLAP
jgi:hypothetical protein